MRQYDIIDFMSYASQENSQPDKNTVQHARSVQEMFSRIARRYDLMNRLMTGGQDINWRREVIRRAQLYPGSLLLDLGAGTGDLSAEAARQIPGLRPVAADFTLQMMEVGRARLQSAPIDWTAADALHLPFPDNHFDAVVSGFLMRNVASVASALCEQQRVLKPGGWIVILDTTRPQPGLMSPLIKFHLRVLIPNLGKIVTGQSDAYRYLPSTTEGFLRAEELAAHLLRAGFYNVGFRRLMFGTIAIHWACK